MSYAIDNLWFMLVVMRNSISRLNIFYMIKKFTFQAQQSVEGELFLYFQMYGLFLQSLRIFYCFCSSRFNKHCCLSE